VENSNDGQELLPKAHKLFYDVSNIFDPGLYLFCIGGGVLGSVSEGQTAFVNGTAVEGWRAVFEGSCGTVEMERASGVVRRCGRRISGYHGLLPEGVIMSIEARGIRPSGSAARNHAPLLTRNNIIVLSWFIVFMALNSILRFHPDVSEPRINLADIGGRLGTGFGSLLFFWIISKGASVSRKIEIRPHIVQISAAVLGLALYIALWIWLIQNTTDLLLIVLVAIPLIPTFYFAIGIMIGLGMRVLSSR
jgi:hypothetical protein